MKSNNSQLNTAVIKIVPIVKKHIGDFDAQLEVWRDGKLLHSTLVTYGRETVIEFLDITRQKKLALRRLRKTA